ncbi:alpha/beta hydrolase [Amycolatopsis alkalitolerans]|uniref:Acyl-CoA:diacylglycerol acyltransferase n=1 Tax=Amycolatopsis alkalitolerans TaxID=2547244 RepID=A0A5C4M1E5_9PSEU|nr:alpha/beta fold hydrolase [Amycolatopsis alkalitolerans]TNC24366.1 alpha/beta hydrolase [Amycolatopsis alkalitolerans]
MNRPRVSRRSMLVAGASGLSVAAFAVGAVAEARHTLGVTRVANRGVASIERVWSAARNRQVDFVTLLPEASPAPNLPMVLVLHGLHGRARAAVPTGTLAELARQTARRAVPPFGLVAVDGGDNYWHEAHPGDNPMAMLLEEVPRWLRQRGLGEPPFGVLGMSMGGFGGLLYARRRGERRQPVRALALLAPALMLSWGEMATRHAFRDAADWASQDPLKHLSATEAVPTGVWCGTEDPFIRGVQRFVAATHPAVAYTAHGKHGDSFNRTVVPSVIGFLGRNV